MKKWLVGVGVLLLVVVLVGAWIISRVARQGLPLLDGRLQLEGLTRTVIIYRDSLGIPHIVAQNEHDLYYATGYVMAQDRIWQMDLLRRVGAGQLAEILGKQFIETDILFRKLRVKENAQAAYQSLPDSVRWALEAYANGVNAYLAEHVNDLPFEFTILGYVPTPWKAEHSLYLVGNMAWDLETGYKMESVLEAVRRKVGEEYLADLIPPQGEPAHPNVYGTFSLPAVDTTLLNAFLGLHRLTTQAFEASNNWVVASDKSITGKPLFANDMHLGLHIPGIWWRAHQYIPGRLNVIGVLLPGVPFVVAGHNDSIAWGMTNVMLDGADFYIEILNDSMTHYQVDGQWRPLEIREVGIAVKGEDSPVVAKLRFTHRGALLSSFGGLSEIALSMRWVGDQPPGEAVALYRINRASNWESFRSAVRHFTNVSQNIAYADVTGNIGIQMVGSVPRRKGVPYFYYPGDTTAYDWYGFVPFDSLPYEFNPSRGYLYSANNQSVDTTYPYYLTRWYYWPPYRAQRIRELLEGAEKVSMDDMQRMLFDHYSIQARELLPQMWEMTVSARNWNGAHQRALEMLRNWDYRYEIDRSEPLIFEMWMMKWVEYAAKDEMGDSLFSFFRDINLYTGYFPARLMDHLESPWFDNVHTFSREDAQDILAMAFDSVVVELVRKYGDLEMIRWGRAHPLMLRHPLGQVRMLDWLFSLNREVAAPGNAHTLNPFKYDWSRPFEAIHGASQKHIYSVANWDASRSVLPTGVSGIPASPFYCNQTDTYVRGGLFPEVFSIEQVERSAMHRLELIPK